MDIVVKISRDYSEANTLAQFINPRDVDFESELVDSGKMSFVIDLDDPQIAEIIEFRKVALYGMIDRKDILLWSGYIDQPDNNLNEVTVNCGDEKDFLRNKMIMEDKDWTSADVDTVLTTLTTEANARKGSNEPDFTYSTDIPDVVVNKEFKAGTSYFDIMAEIAEVIGAEWTVSFSEIKLMSMIGANRANYGLTINKIAHWRFDENSGTIAYDSGSNDIDGNITDGSWIDSPISKHAINLTTGYVDFGNPDILKFEIDDSFSVSFWFRTTSFGTIIAKGIVSGESYRGYLIQLTSSGVIGFYLISTNITNELGIYTVATGFNDGAWHHGVATYDGSQSVSGAKLYVDGELQAVVDQYDSLSASIDTTYNFRIGAGGTGLSSYTGDFDEFIVCDRVLSPVEVKILNQEYDPNLYTEFTWSKESPTENSIIEFKNSRKGGEIATRLIGKDPAGNSETAIGDLDVFGSIEKAVPMDEGNLATQVAEYLSRHGVSQIEREIEIDVTEDQFVNVNVGDIVAIKVEHGSALVDTNDAEKVIKKTASFENKIPVMSIKLSNTTKKVSSMANFLSELNRRLKRFELY